MAIDPKTGMEEVKPVINTEVMKQYNPNYNPNEGVGVSGIVGTPEKPTISASVDPTQVNIGGTNPNIAQQPNEQAKTNLNATISPVSTPQTTSAPPVIEKTTTITPQGEKVVKKEIPTPDFNIGAGREQDILKNLNEGFTNAPYLFQNQDTFRSSYGYATADDTKKRMLDAFFQAKSAQQNNPDALFQQIISNQTIQNPSIRNTPAFKAAQSRASALSINSGLTAKELSDQIKNGSITIGSQAYKDLKATNPQLVQNAERLNAINVGMTGKTDTDIIEANVGNNIIKDIPKQDVPNLQKMLANNPQVVDSLGKSKETKAKMDSLQDQYDNLEEDVKKEYEGRDITAGALQAVISERAKPLIRQLNTLNRTYSNQLADLQYYSDIVKDDYQTAKEEHKTLSDRAYESQKDLREFGQQKELAQFQQELGLKGDQAKFEQQMAQKARIANDPVMATQDVLDTYAKLGILPERSNAEIIQSVQNDIASGMTLGQSLTNLNKAFQSKPQYKEKIAPKQTTAGQVWTKLDESTLYNQVTGETKTVKPGTPVTSEEINSFTTTRNGSTNIQCGELVNDYWKKVTGSSAGIGDSINDKYGAISNIGRSATPVEGGIFVSNPLNNNIGHTGIVSKVNADGSIEVREANAQGKKEGQPPVTRTYSAQQVADMRFSQAPTIKEQETKTVSTSLPLYRKYVEDGAIPPAATLKSMGITADQFTQNAQAGYEQALKQQAQQINRQNKTLNIDYVPSIYSNISATQREKLNESVNKISEVDSRMKQLMDIFAKSGTEILPTKEKTQMQSLRQQIILKAKEIENLGVLNGPDMGILEAIFPETNAIFSFNSNTMAKLKQIQDNYRSDAQSKAINYGAKIQFKDVSDQQVSDISKQIQDRLTSLRAK